MTQKQRYAFPYKFLLSAVYDAAEQTGAQLIGGNSTQGILRIQLPEDYGGLLVQISAVSEDCEITLTADTSEPLAENCAQHSDAAQYFFCVLDDFLSEFN